MLEEKLVLGSEGFFLLQSDRLLLGFNFPLFDVHEVRKSVFDLYGELLFEGVELFFPFFAVYFEFERFVLILSPRLSKIRQESFDSDRVAA